MDRIKKNFGFGYMRLPMIGEEVDIPQTTAMVDAFLENGFNYFDTAHGYIDGRSERAIKECLSSRYPRDRYVLTNKLSSSFFKTREDIRPLFQQQLDACGVEYFDFYLMHAQSSRNFEHYRECKAYETALELKAEGKIRHLGISFHDSAEFLEKILTAYPEVEVVQIQFNYLDYEDDEVQSRKVYEVCRKFNKPVIIMEPVKGGSLANLPTEAKRIVDELHEGSEASYALRFAAGFDGVIVVLSGMSTIEQMNDNISFMKDFKPLDEREMGVIERIRKVFAELDLIPCTACRYCTEQCPQKIAIPNIFYVMNGIPLHHEWDAQARYDKVCTRFGTHASDCIKCGRCEQACPQHIEIRKLLAQAAEKYECK